MPEQDIHAINREIKRLRGALEEIKGTACEVYTRIVGYLRTVDNWNPGKREEYSHRKLYAEPGAEAQPHNSEWEKDTQSTEVAEAEKGTPCGVPVFYVCVTQPGCAECPAAKLLVQRTVIKGRDAGPDDQVVQEYNVMSTPTVLLFDVNDGLVGQASGYAQIKKMLDKYELLPKKASLSV